mgnify:CR=1 FL=1
MSGLSWRERMLRMNQRSLFRSSAVPSEEQFGRYPGVVYEVPRDELRWASPVPVPVPVGTAPLGHDAFGAPPNMAGPVGPQQPTPYGYGSPTESVSGSTGFSDTAVPDTSARLWPGDGPGQN